jgi:hypothetical protein
MGVEKLIVLRRIRQGEPRGSGCVTKKSLSKSVTSSLVVIGPEDQADEMRLSTETARLSKIEQSCFGVIACSALKQTLVGTASERLDQDEPHLVTAFRAG